MKTIQKNMLSFYSFILASLISLLGVTGCKSKQNIVNNTPQTILEEKPNKPNNTQDTIKQAQPNNNQREPIRLMYGAPPRNYEIKDTVTKP